MNKKHSMSYIKLFENYLLDENNNGIVLYHQSDFGNIKEFKRVIERKNKVFDYTFFSFEPQSFIERKFTYKVRIKISSNEIFSIFPQKTLDGSFKGNKLKSNLDQHKEEIIEILKENKEYFYKVWKDTGVDSPGDASQLFREKYNKDANDLELLYWFITYWADSWCLLETDIFLNFIESKGFKSFTTIEEGQLSIAINTKNANMFEILSSELTEDYYN